MQNNNSQLGNEVLLVLVVDGSGSMRSISNSVRKSMNAFVDSQSKERGSAKMTLVTFSDWDEQRTAFTLKDIKQVPNISNKEYYTGGLTAMYDAIGSTIKDIEKSNHKNVFFVVQTDGEENDSRNYDSSNISKMIEEKKKHNWKFLFMGTNINVKEAANRISLGDSFIEFNKSSKGVETAFGEMTREASNYRCSLDSNKLFPKHYI